MALFLVTFFIMALAVGGMAIGVMFGRSPIAGSCGGLNAENGSGECQSCSRPCKAREQAVLQSSLNSIEQPLVQSQQRKHSNVKHGKR